MHTLHSPAENLTLKDIQGWYADMVKRNYKREPNTVDTNVKDKIYM